MPIDVSIQTERETSSKERKGRMLRKEEETEDENELEEKEYDEDGQEKEENLEDGKHKKRRKRVSRSEC